MAKSSKQQILKDEIKVIEELKTNSRTSTDKIAKKCNFSRQKTWRIINNLEKEKIIWGYGTITDNDKLGLKEYHILIKKTAKPIGDILNSDVTDKIGDEAKKLGISIECSHYLHGLYDWEICVTAPDIKMAKKFCEVINKTYYKHISDIILMERIFSTLKCKIPNPNRDKLDEFFK